MALERLRLVGQDLHQNFQGGGDLRLGDVARGGGVVERRDQQTHQSGEVFLVDFEGTVGHERQDGGGVTARGEGGVFVACG